MRFTDWIRLDEIQHVSLPKPTKVNGITTDSIDFRFEDWKRGFNPKKHRTTIIPLSNAQRFFNGSFSAPLTNNYWINVNREGSGPTTFGNLGLALAVQNQIEVSTIPEFATLPKHWFDFAIFYLGNNVVKSPEWPRDNYEAKPMGVARVEPVLRPLS